MGNKHLERIKENLDKATKHLYNAEESANSAGDKSGAKRISITKEEVEKIREGFNNL